MSMNFAGVAFGSQINAAAGRHGLDPRLLAAVAAQETGGPGLDSGSNVVGDAGHGRGLFQIDDRFHSFARTPGAMNPAANADYAAGLLAGLLRRYGGNVHEALSAYNSGSPTATGTRTTWQDGRTLGYADSVLRHYARLGGDAAALTGEMRAESTTALTSLNELVQRAGAQPALAQPRSADHSWRSMAGPGADFTALLD